MTIGYLDNVAFAVPEVCPYCGSEDGFYPPQKRGPHIALKCRHCGGYTFAKQCKGENWARLVKERANYKCERCGKDVRGRGAHAHHCIPKWFMPSKEFDINNGVCLCTECHKQIHGGTGTIKEQED